MERTFSGVHDDVVTGGSATLDDIKLASVSTNGVVAERDGSRIRLWGDLDNARKVRGLAASPDGNVARAILDLFLRFREDAFTMLDGRFALVIESGGRTWVARDRTGAGPPVYYADSGFAFSLRDAMRLPGISRTPDVPALSRRAPIVSCIRATNPDRRGTETRRGRSARHRARGCPGVRAVRFRSLRRRRNPPD